MGIVGGRSDSSEVGTSEPTIALIGGPGDRQVFYASDWEELRRACQRMGRTATDVQGWPLGYRQEAPNSARWLWTNPTPDPA